MERVETRFRLGRGRPHPLSGTLIIHTRLAVRTAVMDGMSWTAFPAFMKLLSTFHCFCGNLCNLRDCLWFPCCYCGSVAIERIWYRHYHILTKRELAKEYTIEDLQWVLYPF